MKIQQQMHKKEVYISNVYTIFSPEELCYNAIDMILAFSDEENDCNTIRKNKQTTIKIF